MGVKKMDRKDVGKVVLLVCMVVGAFLVGSLTKQNTALNDVKANPAEHEHTLDKRDVGDSPVYVRASTNENDPRTRTPKPDGAVYIRWGRTVCPPEAAAIYKGVIAGGHSTHAGGGSEFLCLTDAPEQDKFVAGANGYAYVYGAEFKAHPSLFSSKNLQGFTDHDGNCVACLSMRNSKIMIPGRSSCVPGWTMEYHGVLMSSKYTDKGSKNYICLDWESEADREGYRKDGGADMWPAEAVCGSLPCPPYENAKELSCVVCSR